MPVKPAEKSGRPVEKLTDADRDRALRYLSAEPEMNLFLIGDLLCYGLSGDTVEAFAAPGDAGWEFLLLRFTNQFLLYSRRENYDAAAAAAFLKTRKFTGMSGKASLLNRLLPYLPDFSGRPTLMLRLRRLTRQPPRPEGFVFRRLTADDAESLVDLYRQIEEFRPSYQGSRKQIADRERRTLTHDGRCFGAFSDGRLIAAAASAAENPMSAMVVGVATLPGYRRKGLAGCLCGELCASLLTENRKFLCLFYNNPTAGAIYRRLGFEPVGPYLMMHRRAPATTPAD